MSTFNLKQSDVRRLHIFPVGQILISEMVVPYRGLPDVECAPLIWAMLGHNIACAESCSREPSKSARPLQAY